MNFMSPALLIGLLTTMVPPIIHLIHRRQARVVPFPALEFILRSNKKTARRFRLKQILLLVVRSLLLGLVAFALARPYVSHVESALAAASGSAGTTVVVIDASYPMHYQHNGESLLDLARFQAGQILDDLGAQGQAALVVAGHPVQVPVGEPTHDLDPIRKALEQIEAGYGFGSLPEATARAYDLLTDQPAAGGLRVVVLTTARGAASTLPEPPSSPSGTAIDLIPVDVTDGAPSPNRAVVSVRLRPAPELGAHQWRVDADIANLSDGEATRLPVWLEIDGETKVRGFITLRPGETRTKTFHARIDSDRAIQAQVVLEPDNLTIDDRRPFWLRPAPQIRVLAVNGDPHPTPYRDELFYLERALAPGTEGGTRVRLSIADHDTLDRFDFDDFDVVILANFGEPEQIQAHALEAFVRAGGGLLLTMGNQIDPEISNSRLASLLPRALRHQRHAGDAAASPEGRDRRHARPKQFDRAHPALRPFGDPAATSLSRSRVIRYMLLDPSPDAKGRVVIELDDGVPLLLTRAVERGRVALLTTTIDRDWGDLPIRPDFLPLIQQLMRFLTRVAEVDARPLMVGGPAPIPVDDPRVRRVRVSTPRGEVHAVERPTSRGERWVFDGTRVPGHYAVAPDPPLPGLMALPGFSVAVDPGAADLRGPRSARVAQEHQASPGLPRKHRTELWHSALAGLFILLGAEAALLFKRRRRVGV